MKVMIYFILLSSMITTINSCVQLQTLKDIRKEVEYLREDLRKVNKK